MICCCSMAGTSACQYCNANPNAKPSPYHTYITTTGMAPIDVGKLYYVPLPQLTDEQKMVIMRQWFPDMEKYFDDGK